MPSYPLVHVLQEHVFLVMGWLLNYFFSKAKERCVCPNLITANHVTLELTYHTSNNHFILKSRSEFGCDSVANFMFSHELEDNFTARGRLHYAGIRNWQMSEEVYRKTWKPYEKLMVLSLESAIDEASSTIAQYKKQTYKK